LNVVLLQLLKILVAVPFILPVMNKTRTLLLLITVIWESLPEVAVRKFHQQYAIWYRTSNLINQDRLFETREDLLRVIRCFPTALPHCSPYLSSSLQQANHFIDFGRHIAGKKREAAKGSRGRCCVVAR